MSILSALLGHSQDRIWRTVAEELGGELRPSDLWHGTEIRVRVDAWTLTLDVAEEGTESSTWRYTRLRVPYLNPEGFRFQLSRSSPFSGLAKLLGGQDIEIGDPEFDKAFVIEATHPDRMRELLNPALRERLLSHREFALQVKDDEGWLGETFPKGVDELYMTLPGEQPDIALLKASCALLAATLRRLCEIGGASAGSPHFKL